MGDFSSESTALALFYIGVLPLIRLLLFLAAVSLPRPCHVVTVPRYQCNKF